MALTDGDGGAEEASIRFRLDPRSGLPPYRQLADQVRHAVSLGWLQPGDRLPSVREVVTQITINPNTVHRAYRELEAAGVTEARQGLGTFVSINNGTTSSSTPAHQAELLGRLGEWVRQAQAAGLDEDAIRALVSEAFDGAMSSLFKQ